MFAAIAISKSFIGAGFGLLTSVQVVPLWSRFTGDMRRVCVCVCV